MVVDRISYSYSYWAMTVYAHKDGKKFPIGEVEITDRDFDEDEDAEYMQNLAEELAEEKGYKIGSHGEECALGGDTSNDCEDCVYSGYYHFEKGECMRRKD